MKYEANLNKGCLNLEKFYWFILEDLQSFHFIDKTIFHYNPQTLHRKEKTFILDVKQYNF